MKRYVLRRDLNVVSEGEWRTDWGREFQSRGAVRENALSPKVFNRDIGIVRVRVEEERVAREGRWGRRRSDR